MKQAADRTAIALEEVARALENLKYGSIELTLHDGRLVQIERREKLRFEPDGRPVSQKKD
jgi:hypothetical protein